MQPTLDNMNTMFKSAVVRLKREHPHLTEILAEPPCYFCHVTGDPNGHCNSEFCPELTAWLMESSNEINKKEEGFK